MRSPNLFFSPLSNEYLWTGEDICKRCTKICEVYALLLWDYYQYSFFERIFCVKCRDEILKAGGKYKEFKRVVLVFDGALPDDAVPVWPQRPSLGSSKGESTFDVAVNPMEGKVIDNTTLLSRQSIWDAQIGADMKAYLEEKDKTLQFDEGLAVLEDLRRAEPLDSRFQLEEDVEMKRLN